jgi:hypothetical protein
MPHPLGENCAGYNGDDAKGGAADPLESVL